MSTAIASIAAMSSVAAASSIATEPTDGALADCGAERSRMPDVGMVATLLLDASDDGLEQPCRTEDPDLWFAEAPAELEQAKQLCRACPVRHACLAAALARGERWGVWGGEIFHRGVVLPFKRPRGRPRKVRSIGAPADSAV